MANTKEAIEKTTKRVVAYLNDDDFYKFNLVVADRGIKPSKYLRLLLLAHLRDLEKRGQIVINNVKEDEDL